MRAPVLTLAITLAALASRAAGAQTLAEGDARAAGLRPVATYRVADAGAADGMASRVTLADSSGTLVATYTLAGERTARPMVVAIDGTDILLGADTPRGALQIMLLGRNDERSAGGRTAGLWALGDTHGVLVARTVR